jgi:hypothetical protein
MKASRGSRGWGMLALVLATGVTACKDSGLPDRNLPFEEARNRQYGYPVYQPLAGNVPVAAAGRHWLRSAEVMTIPGGIMEPVAAAEGTQLYTVRGTRAPYDRLYAPLGQDRWAPYLRLN